MAKYVFRYSRDCQESLKQIGIHCKTKPEPWLHIIVHVADNSKPWDFWAILVWDTRQIVESGKCIFYPLQRRQIRSGKTGNWIVNPAYAKQDRVEKSLPDCKLGLVRRDYADRPYFYSKYAKVTSLPLHLANDNAKSCGNAQFDVALGLGKKHGSASQQDDSAFNNNRQKAQQAEDARQAAPHNVRAIYVYDDKVQQQVGAKTKPEPWLHIACTQARWAIYVWDKREIIEEGPMPRYDAVTGKKANDSHEPLKGDAASKFNFGQHGIQATQKDFMRMTDFAAGNSRISGIKDKNKAIARFAALCYVVNERPRFDVHGPKTSNPKLLELWELCRELGVTKEDIYAAYNDTDPTQFNDAINARRKRNDEGSDKFIGKLKTALFDANIDYKVKLSSAMTEIGRNAMQRNGRKWTIGYNITMWPGTKSEQFLEFDAITDEGDGPTKYIYSNSSFPAGPGMREWLHTAVRAGNDARPK